MSGKNITRFEEYALTIVVMIAAIPYVTNDYLLVFLYLFTPLLLFRLAPERYDPEAYLLGLIGITAVELFFIHTGVETFNRATLFGVMPIWLPFLWAYAFVVIKRVLKLLSTPARVRAKAAPKKKLSK
jgi:hypothetical protein